MMITSGSMFRYLNREGRWLDFHWHGLELQEDGSLKLASIPMFTGVLPQELINLPASDGPGGITVSTSGIIYISVPNEHRIIQSGECESGPGQVPCLGGEGTGPGQFRFPRGLLYHRIRNALFVADSGNHRIQIFDVGTFQLMDIWGRRGTEAGEFDTPTALAGDNLGNIWVVDSGNKRVQMFDFRGEVLPYFWERLQHDVQLENPTGIVAVSREKDAWVYILDSQKGAVYVAAPNGELLRSFELRYSGQLLSNALGIAADQDGVYIGDNFSRQIHKFTPDGAYLGSALKYSGPIAALAIDQATLVVLAGDQVVLSLSSTGGAARHGFLFGGPFENPNEAREQWHRIKARASLSPNSHLQLYYSGSPVLRQSALNSAQATFPQPDWISLPLDALETLYSATTQNPISVAAVFMSEGYTSPVLYNIRVDYDHKSLLEHLPAIYQEDETSRIFLLRFLAIFQSQFEDVQTEIDALSSFFDAYAAPEKMLGWLAGWLGLELQEEWPLKFQREFIAKAFARFAWRGTAEGLQQSIRTLAGIEARIEEPIVQSGLWILPEEQSSEEPGFANSLLGFTSVLPAADPFGAVLGGSAVLDRSHLIDSDQSGDPLFDDVAFQFKVRIYRGSKYSKQLLQKVQRLVESEKPAHTLYHLCVTEPRMQVGFQSRIGIDSIIGAPADAEEQRGLVLGGHPAGRIASDNQIGISTRLGNGSVE